MKKFIVGILALMMGVAVTQAAVDVQLVNGSGNDLADTTFTYTDLDSTVGFTSGAMGSSALLTPGGSLSGSASGSFTIAWTATTETNALMWSFDTSSAYEIRDFPAGWGGSLLNSGFGTFEAGEVFLLSFDTTGLTTAAGEKLVFSLSTKDSNDEFAIYQRTGESSGVLLQGVSNLSGYSMATEVADAGGYVEFAIVGVRGFDLFNGFRVDVIGDITSTAKPTGLDGIALDSGALLSWASDTTGLLDYYTVYRSTISDANTYVAITNVVDAAFADSGLINDTTYFYAVTAVGTNGTPEESAFSDELSLTPIALSTTEVLLMHYSVYEGNTDSVELLGSDGTVSAWANVAPDYLGVYDAIPEDGFAEFPSTNFSVTGKAGVEFTTNRASLAMMTDVESALLLDTTGGKSGLVVMMALRSDFVVGQDDFFGNGSNTGFGMGLRRVPEGIQIWGQGAVATLATVATNGGETIVVSYRYDVASYTVDAWESASGNELNFTDIFPGDFTTGNPLTMGSTTSRDRFLNGQIFEVKVWGSTLDNTTLEAERNAMVQRWIGAGAGYDAWASQWGSIGETTNDFDSDGLNNLYEYGLDGNPTNFTQAPAILPVLTKVGNGFEYMHVQLNSDPSLVYTVETSTDLVNIAFTNSGYSVSGTNDGAGFFDTVTNSIPTDEDQLFIKLIIEN